MKLFDIIVGALTCAALILLILNAFNIIRWRWILIFTPRFGFIVAIILVITFVRRRIHK